jgi:hypothetical protein
MFNFLSTIYLKIMMDDANLDKPEEDTSEGKRCRKALRMKS